jgi:pyruvate/2-oxoglutarate dehydrogenase complex dihydrolipoamide dehydrogenase (E3) component
VGALQGRKVAVYGGGETGCETAEYLAEHGAQVTLVTRSPATQLARSAERFYRMALLERLTSNPGITVRDKAHVTAIGEKGLTLAGAEAGEQRQDVDHTFIAQGQTPDPTMSAELEALGVPHAVIGDSVRVRRIGNAVDDAYRAVWMLSERLKPQLIAC